MYNPRITYSTTITTIINEYTQPQIANLLHCCYIEQLLPEDYNGSGNITRNTKVSPYYYSYNASQPNAVSGIESNPGMVSSAQCDGTSASGTRGEALCVVAPSLFREKIESISQDGWTLQLAYGDGLQRESEVLTHNSTAVCTTNFVSGDCEHEIRPGGSRYLDHIRADGRIVAIHVKNGTTDSIYYVQTDLCGSRELSQACLDYAEMQQSVRSNLLGSWEKIVDNNRNVVQSSHFDPWDEQVQLTCEPIPTESPFCGESIGGGMSATDWTAGQDGTSFSFYKRPKVNGVIPMELTLTTIFSETWANRLASRYFRRIYGYSWNEYGYPLYNWR